MLRNARRLGGKNYATDLFTSDFFYPIFLLRFFVCMPNKRTRSDHKIGK